MLKAVVELLLMISIAMSVSLWPTAAAAGAMLESGP
jgi:hypothetical protein